MLCSKIIDARLIASFVPPFTIKDALSKVHAVHSGAILQVVHILLGRIQTANANRIRAIFTTIGALITARATIIAITENSSALRQATIITAIIGALNIYHFAFIFAFFSKFLVTEIRINFCNIIKIKTYIDKVDLKTIDKIWNISVDTRDHNKVIKFIYDERVQ